MLNKDNSGTNRDLTKEQKIIASGGTDQQLKKELEDYDEALRQAERQCELAKTDPESQKMLKLVKLQRARVRRLIADMGTNKLKKLFEESKTNQAKLSEAIRELTAKVNAQPKNAASLTQILDKIKKDFKFYE